CGDVYTDVIPALGHEFDYCPAVEPTTGADGNLEYWYCPTCGRYYFDADGLAETTWDELVIPALPAHVHDYNYLVTVEPGCKTPGELTCTCPGCGDVYTDVIPALGHEFDYYPAVEPTTETDGNMEYWYCPTCGRYYLDADGLAETSWDELVIPALPAHVHTLTYVPAAEPTTEADGNVEYWYCPDCGSYFLDADGLTETSWDELVIPALPEHVHTLTYFPAVEPTTGADGNVEYWYCPDCGKYFLDANGWTETSADEVVLPKLDDPTPPATTPILTVESVAGRSGSVVDVKIDLADNPGIAGAMLRLDYAPELVLKNITAGDALAGLTFTRPGDLSENPVTLFWDGLDADATNGTVLTLTFEIPATAADGLYAVTLSCEPDGVYADDLTDVLPTFVDGGITVRNVLRGDMNGDNMRNAKDVTMMRRALAGGYGISVSLDSADVNNDGSVNAKDVTTLRRFLAGGYNIVID
ncbi:MAG: dockerin type I domain-containing protein, partial [Oscillospiraceae bacterium]|nr:dockerin type I domain-containing protein [Oscillospiraceae bacterium]